jgi:hypothetical protein
MKFFKFAKTHPPETCQHGLKTFRIYITQFTNIIQAFLARNIKTLAKICKWGYNNSPPPTKILDELESLVEILLKLV